MNDLYYISPEWKGTFISAVFANDTRFIIYFIYPVLLYLRRLNTRKWIIDVTKKFKPVLRPKVKYSNVSHIRQLVTTKKQFVF
jgi:hypothetical protein